MNEKPLPGKILALLLLGVPSAVLGLSGFPLIILAALAGIGFLSLRSATGAGWARLFWSAAFFGTLGESVCVLGDWTGAGTGLWIYRFPQPFGWNLDLPIWLPLVWGNLFILFVGLAERIPVSRLSETRAGEIIRYLLALLVVCYAALLFRTVRPGVLVVFTPFFAAFLLYWNSLRDLSVFVIAGALGSLGEILAMRQGLWEYTLPVFKNDFTAALGVPSGIPLSLAMAWGLSAVFLRRIAWARR